MGRGVGGGDPPGLCGPGLLLRLVPVLAVLAAAGAAEQSAAAGSPAPDGTVMGSGTPPSPGGTASEETRLHVFTLDYPHVQIPFEITLWILLASLAKIGEPHHQQPHSPLPHPFSPSFFPGGPGAGDAPAAWTSRRDLW